MHQFARAIKEVPCLEYLWPPKTEFGGLETTQAYERRLQAGFFDRFFSAGTPASPLIVGADLGCSSDGLYVPDNANILAFGWELYPHGDATELSAIEDGCLDFVYTSHLLEHVTDDVRALTNWMRVVRPGGTVVLSVPHRDYYEKRTELPSRWNAGHRRFYLPFEDIQPTTLSLYDTLDAACRLVGGCQILCLNEQVTGCTNWHDPEEHANGEYCIEAVIQVG